MSAQIIFLKFDLLKRSTMLIKNFCNMLFLFPSFLIANSPQIRHDPTKIQTCEILEACAQLCAQTANVISAPTKKEQCGQAVGLASLGLDLAARLSCKYSERKKIKKEKKEQEKKRNSLSEETENIALYLSSCFPFLPPTDIKRHLPLFASLYSLPKMEREKEIEKLLLLPASTRELAEQIMISALFLSVTEFSQSIK